MQLAAYHFQYLKERLESFLYHLSYYLFSSVWINDFTIHVIIEKDVTYIIALQRSLNLRLHSQWSSMLWTICCVSNGFHIYIILSNGTFKIGLFTTLLSIWYFLPRVFTSVRLDENWYIWAWDFQSSLYSLAWFQNRLYGFVYEDVFSLFCNHIPTDATMLFPWQYSDEHHSLDSIV